MGITIEQHRARIGAHNCMRGDVRHIILMLFQLVITIIVLAMFVRICYLNIYVRRFTQVIESFTQITGYIVYIPLLLRMANDVEENPGPTIYDVVDPTKTICADFSQGNAKKFRQNAGKQCLAMHVLDCNNI
jgi:hypothetical protein